MGVVLFCFVYDIMARSCLNTNEVIGIRCQVESNFRGGIFEVEGEDLALEGKGRLSNR